MNLRTVLLNILFNCLWTSTALGYQILICGATEKNTNLSTVEIEQIAREESRKLIADQIIDPYEICHALEANKIRTTKHCLLKTGEMLGADFVLQLRLNSCRKSQRIFLSAKLLDIANRKVAAKNALSFDQNPPQTRRMIRICLRDIYQHFYEINNQIITQNNQ